MVLKEEANSAQTDEQVRIVSSFPYHPVRVLDERRNTESGPQDMSLELARVWGSRGDAAKRAAKLAKLRALGVGSNAAACARPYAR